MKLPPQRRHRRRFLLRGSCVLLTLICVISSLAPAEPPAPIQVMVLGTYHFDNPGMDLHNMKVDDVRTPARQAELADLAERLAKFQPTKIAVESVSDRPDFTSKKYESFTPEALAKDANEIVQIGFRLAQKLGHRAVYGIDEQSATFDYFPFGKVQDFAKAHGREALLNDLHARVETMLREREAAQKTTPIREMLARINEPAVAAREHGEFYYGVLGLGDEKTQPGADLNGAWYLRNAKIFAKLTQVTRPGDRVLVIYGAGHDFWLRHFAALTPGFVSVEPVDYLR